MLKRIICLFLPHNWAIQSEQPRRGYVLHTCTCCKKTKFVDRHTAENRHYSSY
jgi:hypothetical protein